ncbi:hypothetical protein AALP_AA8G214800 [Arabis alpina]|uniref:Transcription repressor n=1 Tax=Arabis alpina TaxID=50452 RepID=A0A087G8J2_ARAAL|nr:hypothetical protein AALP_AA8G214800 [Arabis alpina]
MEKRMKLGLSRLLRSSLSSCRQRELYDVVETCTTFTSRTTCSELTKPAKTKTPRQKHTPVSSPIFPPNPFYEGSRSFRKTKTTKSKKIRSQFGSDSLLMTSRFKSSGSWCWSCSEDEQESDDTETLFSSRSFSSDSSESFAVVKKSEDPYEDFRSSMVEMIVERQIFGAVQLQELLQCFLSLNSRQHHSVIVQVFLEIYATLFSP